MNPNRASWEKGDFTEIAAFMRQSGEALVESLGITTPMRIRDVGCGGQLVDLATTQARGSGRGISISATFMRVTVSP